MAELTLLNMQRPVGLHAAHEGTADSEQYADNHPRGLSVPISGNPYGGIKLSRCVGRSRKPSLQVFLATMTALSRSQLHRKELRMYGGEASPRC